MLKKGLLFGIAASLAIAMACGGDNKTPVSPSATTATDADAAADGSTLKVNAPTLQTPAAGTTTDTLTPNFVLANSTPKFASASAVGSLEYEYSIETAAGTVLVAPKTGGGQSLTGYRVAEGLLQFDTAYRWRARAVQGSLVGPWAGYISFRTMAKPIDPFEAPGYIKATEIWDPLTKGVSVGTPVNMEFTQGVGARTVGNESYIRYALLQTLEAGEFSFYAYNLNPLSAGDKTKLMSMAEGDGDITTNDYRFTVEKRGASYTSPGQVRIRIINGDSGEESSIHDSSPTVPPLVKAQWYFVKLTWGNNFAQLRIYNTSPTGSLVASVNVGYPGRQYRPTPHMAFVGAPTGRAGSIDASVANMTVKGVFIGGAGTVRPGALPGMDIDR